MEFQQYIESNNNKKPNADVIQRWGSRVVPRSLNQQGAAGARQYLADYGKGIAAPKVIMLARQAENMGCGDMALEFWKKAYELEFGTVPTGGMAANSVGATSLPVTHVIQASDPAFPPNLQPGHVVPMQPEDAKNSREFYIQNSMYGGQGKRDGNKVLIFGTPDKAYFQSRSMKFRSSPGIEFEDVIKKTAARIGSFILEGEQYFLDVNGKEHRTSAQAATANISAGLGAVTPKLMYAIFSGIWWGDHNHLRQNDRIANGDRIFKELCLTQYGVWESFGDTRNTPMEFSFEFLPVARTETEKRALADQQKKEGREGEVWFRLDMDYRPDKRKDDYYVRTKYTIELNVRVTGLTPTTAAGRPFGAIEVVSLDGKPLGAIGTGFTLDQMHKIVKLFHSGSPLIIPVVAQGYTENGILFQGRLSEDFD